MENLVEISGYNLIFYFIIYSFIAWIMESSFKSLLYRKVINSGFLNGPFIPIYGIGAIFAILFFQRFSNNTIILFFLGMMFMSLIEYLVGLLMEKMFNTSWWDYTGNFMNLGGKICLENSLYWGILIVLLIEKIHPAINALIETIPPDVGEICIAIFVIYFVIDYMITLIEVLNLQEKVGMFINLKDNAIVLATTSKIKDLKKYIAKRSKRILNAYPRLTYLKINKKLRDIVGEIRMNKRL